MELKLPIYVKSILKTLNDAGYDAYVVGGAVRDLILGIEPNDYDITTNATPDIVENLFADTIPTGKQYGTISVLWHSEDGVSTEIVEVTTYRKDSNYSDGRRPDEVTFGQSLEDDLLRRDFTINAMAYNPREGLVDYFNGLDDIKSCIINCVGNAENRFKEDALRMLRAIRFACKYNFHINLKTSEAVEKLYPNILKYVAKERITKELIGIFTHLKHNAAHHITLSPYNKVMGLILNCKFNHMKYSSDLWSKLQFCNDWAFKLHLFIQYLDEPIKNIDDILINLKFSTSDKNRIVNYNKIQNFIEKGMDFTTEQNPKTRVLRNMFEPYYSMYISQLNEKNELVRYYKLNKDYPYKVSDLVITGDDIMAKGFKGEDVGKLLNFCMKMVISQPKLNKKEILENFLTKENLNGVNI